MVTNQPSGFNLVQWLSTTVPVNGTETKRTFKVQTHIYNKPYGLCKGEKNKLEARKWLPGTFFTIEINK